MIPIAGASLIPQFAAPNCSHFYIHHFEDNYNLIRRVVAEVTNILQLAGLSDDRSLSGQAVLFPWALLDPLGCFSLQWRQRERQRQRQRHRQRLRERERERGGWGGGGWADLAVVNALGMI